MRLELDMRSLAYFDDARNAWVAGAGDFELRLGQSSADLPITLPFRLLEEWSESVSVIFTSSFNQEAHV